MGIALRKYLLVDDNRAFLENLAEIVADGGAAVSVANSGADALAMLEHHSFDVLVTDMRMPGMNGDELLQAARRKDPALAAILVTAYAGEASLRTARLQGMLAVLPKPVPVDQLLRLLNVARRGAIVALVEDDARLSDSLVEVLTSRGFTAIAVRTWSEAAALADLHPLAALVDLLMPDSPEGEVLAAAQERFPGVPVIAMTASSELAARMPTKVLQKPFDAAELVMRLEQIYAARESSARA